MHEVREDVVEFISRQYRQQTKRWTLLTVQARGIELRFDERELDGLSGGLGSGDSSKGERAGGDVGEHGGVVCEMEAMCRRETV